MLLILSLFLLLDGCKEDDPLQNPAEQLIGIWKETSYVVTECTDTAENENETCSSNCEIWVFTSTTITEDNDTPDPYTISGNIMTIDGSVFEFSINGTTLTLMFKSNAANGNCKIVTTFNKQ